jgi:cobalt-zinc-cadmium resistance protein CzcA
LGVLVNSKERVEPVADNFVYTVTTMPDTSVIEKNPFYVYQQQLLELSQSQYKLEKSKLWPTFNAGINSSTIIGWQATSQNTEEYYGSSKRFNSFTAGIGVPLFSKAQRSRIDAAEVLSQQRVLELSATKQKLDAELINAQARYQRTLQLIRTYQDNLLPSVATVMSTATNKLNSGEIGYLNWVILVNNAIQIRSDYFNTVMQLNEAAIEIERISALN